MSTTQNPHNFKLLQSLHQELSFLKQFTSDQLQELSSKAYFFVFSHGTVLAQEKEEIDYFGVVLEGKISITGTPHKEGPGYQIGTLAHLSLISKHVYSVIGDSDGIVLAIRYEDIGKMSKDFRNALNFSIIKNSLDIVKDNKRENEEIEIVEEKKIVHLVPAIVKNLLQDHFDVKEKQNFLKFFPYSRYSSKSQICEKTDQSYLLFVIQGELIVKDTIGSQINENTFQTPKKLLPSEIFNCEGFLLNYNPSCNIYCFSEEAIVIKVYRKEFETLMEGTTMHKLCCFLMRYEINEKKYEVVSYDKRKEKEEMTKSNTDKWSIFTKNNYQILPIKVPKSLVKETKTSTASPTKQPIQQLGTLFREQLQPRPSNGHLKTQSTLNTKLSKIITLKTEKNEEKSSIEQQLKELQKEHESLSNKLKHYNESYLTSKLETIEYKSKYQMHSVLKEICEIGDKKYKIGTIENVKVMTLKQAVNYFLSSSNKT